MDAVLDAVLVIPLLKILAQIVFLAIVVYRLYDFFHQSRALVIFHIIIAYGFIMLVSHYLGFKVLEGMMERLFVPFFIFIVVVHQEEIRGILSNIQNPIRMIRKKTNYASSSDVEKILGALYTLADMKRGALVIIKKSDSLIDKLKNTPTELDCAISSSMIVTIFSYDTPLHDGAIIVADGRIHLAGCVLPSSGKGSIRSSEYAPEDKADENESDDGNARRSGRRDPHRGDKVFGTRHRAAIGITEVSDAIAIVVSEESKALSVCYGGDIYYDLGQEDATAFLGQLLGYESRRE